MYTCHCERSEAIFPYAISDHLQCVKERLLRCARNDNTPPTLLLLLLRV
jgi:hypothetical protein